MKKIFALLVVILAISSVDAQVQRKKLPATDSTVTARADNHQGSRRLGKNGRSNIELLKELNLTSDQKDKIKELRQANKAKRNEIQQDTTLTEAQKQEKNKEVSRSTLVNIQQILTPEQREKMKAMMKERKLAKQEAGQEDKADSIMEEQ